MGMLSELPYFPRFFLQNWVKKRGYPRLNRESERPNLKPQQNEK